MATSTPASNPATLTPDQVKAKLAAMQAQVIQQSSQAKPTIPPTSSPSVTSYSYGSQPSASGATLAKPTAPPATPPATPQVTSTPYQTSAITSPSQPSIPSTQPAAPAAPPAPAAPGSINLSSYGISNSNYVTPQQQKQLEADYDNVQPIMGSGPGGTIAVTGWTGTKIPKATLINSSGQRVVVRTDNKTGTSVPPASQYFSQGYTLEKAPGIATGATSNATGTVDLSLAQKPSTGLLNSGANLSSLGGTQYGKKISNPSDLKNYTESQIVRAPNGDIYLKQGVTPVKGSDSPSAPNAPSSMDTTSKTQDEAAATPSAPSSDSTTPGSTTDTATTRSGIQSQYDALVQKISDLQQQYSSGSQSQADLDKVLAQQATANQQLQDLVNSEAAGLKDVQGRPVAQSIQSGLALDLQQQEEAKAAPIQSLLAGLSGQEMTLKEKLAQEQANRQYALASLQTQAQAEEAKLTQAAPQSLAPGQTVYDPITGTAKYTAPVKPITVAAGSEVIDPTTGNVIAKGQPKTATGNLGEYQVAQSQGFTGSLIDYIAQKKGAGAAANMDPADITFLAQNYLATGSLPSFGYGASGSAMKAKVLHEAQLEATSQGLTGQSVALNQASYKANSDALKKITDTSALSQTYEKTASANLDIAAALSKKVDRTGSPILNKYVNYLQGKFAGDSDTTQFAAAVKTAANEYAKVTTGSLGNAGITDSAARDMENLLNTSLSNGTFQNQVMLLKQEMQNRMNSFADTKAELQSNIGGPSNSGAGTPSSNQGSSSSSGGFATEW